MPELATLEQHIQAAAANHARTNRFLRGISWGIVGTLCVMAISLFVAEYAEGVRGRRLAFALPLGATASFAGLIALAALLRAGLSRHVANVAQNHQLLLVQNDRLIAQNEELRESERREHALLEETRLLARRLTEAQQVAKLGYWEIDASTKEVFWSEEMYHLCGVEPNTQPPPTERFLEAVHPDDRPKVRGLAAAAMNEVSDFSEQYRIRLPGQPMRTIHATGRLIVDTTGVRKLVGTVQDISERQQLEAQLRQSQKMDAIGQLAGGVAHDFNNLLTVIDGYSSLLSAHANVDAPDHRYVLEIRAAAQRAASLTRQLLAFTRKQDARAVVFDLNETIQRASAMLHRLIGEDIEILTVLAPDLHLIMADPGGVEQVLINLAVNARDAMPDGGTLTVETANVVLDPAYAQADPARVGPHVMLAVTDTGVGMDVETQSRMFEPFFTTKEVGKGTGLGLAMVYGIVQQAGGHVRVDSETGRGSSFRIYFPVGNAAASPHRATSTIAPPHASGERVLLVEDDDAVRTLATRVLEAGGYEVTAVRNGQEAIAIAGRQGAVMDLLLSDVVMPGMKGDELAQSIRAHWPRMKIVLMSGYTPETIGRLGVASHSDATLQKPFTPEELKAVVRQVLDRETP